MMNLLIRDFRINLETAGIPHPLASMLMWLRIPRCQRSPQHEIPSTPAFPLRRRVTASSKSSAVAAGVIVGVDMNTFHVLVFALSAQGEIWCKQKGRPVKDVLWSEFCFWSNYPFASCRSMVNE
jgi:hypothetical protein